MGKHHRLHRYRFHCRDNSLTTRVGPQTVLANSAAYLPPPLPCGRRGRAEPAFDKRGASRPSVGRGWNGGGSPHLCCVMEEVEEIIQFSLFLNCAGRVASLRIRGCSTQASFAWV